MAAGGGGFCCSLVRSEDICLPLSKKCTALCIARRSHRAAAVWLGERAHGVTDVVLAREEEEEQDVSSGAGTAGSGGGELAQVAR